MVLSKDLKLAICFGLIMGALISIFNMCFAAETENVDVSVIPDLGFTVSNPVIYSVSGSGVCYFEMEPGYVYHISSGNSNRIYGFSNDLPDVGVTITNANILSSNSSIDINSNYYHYLYFNMYNYSTTISVTREPLGGMTNFVDNLTYDLSYANLSGVLFFVVPIMAIAILVALGFYLLKRLLNRIKRAKGGV